MATNQFGSNAWDWSSWATPRYQTDGEGFTAELGPSSLYLAQELVNNNPGKYTSLDAAKQAVPGLERFWSTGGQMGDPMPWDDYVSWQGVTNPNAAKLTFPTKSGYGSWLDPATGLVNYELKSNSAMEDFTDFATIPAMFAAMALTAGAASGALGGAGAAGAGAAGIAEGALGGAIGGSVGGAGLGGAGALGAAGAGLGALDAAWGANPSEFGNWGADMTGAFDAGGMPSYTSPGGNWWDSLSQFTPDTGTFTGGTASSGTDWLQQIGKALNMTNADGSVNLGSLVKLLPNVLGAFGSSSQANAMSDVQKNQAALQQQAMAMGEPYRAQALKMLQNPDSFFSGPVAQSNLAGVLQGLSVNGNPFGNPTSLALAQQGQRGLYNQTLANLGQMGGLSGYNAAGANQSLGTELALMQAKQQGLGYNAIGAGFGTLSDIINPPAKPITLADIVKLIGGGGTALGGVASGLSNADIASAWTGLA